MKNKAVYMDDLHFEHKHWLSQLEFQVDELKIFTHRIEEVVVRWTDKDVLARLEQFQNKFIVHKEVLDTLFHDINLHEQELVKFAKDHPVAVNHVHFKDHGKLRDYVEMQIKLFNELKKEFMRFLSFAM